MDWFKYENIPSAFLHSTVKRGCIICLNKVSVVRPTLSETLSLSLKYQLRTYSSFLLETV